MIAHITSGVGRPGPSVIPCTLSPAPLVTIVLMSHCMRGGHLHPQHPDMPEAPKSQTNSSALNLLSSRGTGSYPVRGPEAAPSHCSCPHQAASSSDPGRGHQRT